MHGMFPSRAEHGGRLEVNLNSSGVGFGKEILTYQVCGHDVFVYMGTVMKKEINQTVRMKGTDRTATRSVFRNSYIGIKFLIQPGFGWLMKNRARYSCRHAVVPCSKYCSQAHGPYCDHGSITVSIRNGLDSRNEWEQKYQKPVLRKKG